MLFFFTERSATAAAGRSQQRLREHVQKGNQLIPLYIYIIYSDINAGEKITKEYYRATLSVAIV